MGIWRSAMKIYAIFANDNTKGTTSKLFYQAIDALKKQGHEVDILNLYDREKEMPFFRHDRAYMENHPFYLENKNRFLQADALLLVFPLFWYSVPGILKTWLDMINGWAYKYESGKFASPLHKIKQALIIYSSMQEKESLAQNLQAPVEEQLAQTCKFIGIDKIHVYQVDKVTKLNPKDLEEHLTNVSKFCKNCA
jgi:putative NADPH-quinone reductase